KTKSIIEAYPLPPLPEQLVQMVSWLRQYYPAPLGATTLAVLPGQLTAKHIEATPGITGPVAINDADLPPLTAEQQAVLDGMSRPDTFILHGDTGTGKTRVYIEQAARTIKSGRSVIVLTPEISLTSQLAQNFQQIFGERVVVVHSGLTPKARQLAWLTILRSSQNPETPVIVLGPRSALFAPVANLGLIVVDEAHEPAYKQESAPHYHAVRVASQLAHLHQAALILGSATPGITDYFIAEQKKKPILRMQQSARSSEGSEVTVELVDLKDRDKFSRSQYISDPLIAAIKNSIGRGEQSLLYLNRRGTARVILCNNCGWQAACPHCDLPLTYHHDVYQLQCHTCGWHNGVPTSCPDCQNTEIVFKVVGTKAIEEEVARLFPEALAMRFDTDNKTAERFEKHYEAVRSGEVDILVGTQLLAKGLDLPKLTTLGVVIADTSLTFPDYSAEERTYQLLNQVIGRVGRGHSAREKIVVQSYDPQRPVIQAALASDWDTFYQAELAERQLFNFPPFCYVLQLACRMASSKAAEAKTEQFMYTIQQLGLPLSVEGPSPSFHAKAEGKFEWQLIVKSRRRDALLEVIKALPKSSWSYDIDPINLL
ncbi:MAG TPA: primosomal protein N', partial [Candidatus Saccharimonadales bacterium]|nr:primosomal protein N' [Candidatus Saccharimonadales bacterium]